MKRAKPLFRFVGVTDGSIESQFDVAQAVQEFFFVLSDAGLNGSTREISGRFGQHISGLRTNLRAVGVVVAEPSWFAELFR